MTLYFRIKNGLYSRFFRLFYRKKFKYFGKNSNVLFPLKIDGINNMSIGNNVYIAPQSWLSALPITIENKVELVIGDGTNIGHFNHIYSTKSIIIGKKVLTADKVYISDNLHSYENINIPIIDQPIKQISMVEIGDGSWLGENVCVIGAKVGKNCVIGANSVVTKDIPDYCVAVGSPAKVIKRFDFDSLEWKNC
jgi:acetyltransferase-like isoleucine patch superfamily enzyme